MYYSIVDSLSSLLGEEGILRLPAYLPNVFVFDNARLTAIDKAINSILRGRNVLITGSPGSGKTALMFMVLSKISQTYRIGYILEGVSSITNDHLREGIILFYDDLPRMKSDALKSIFYNNVHSLIATARTEELSVIERILGVKFAEIFDIVEIPPLEPEKLREMLLKYLEAEAIRVEDPESLNKVVEKAMGLPVYIWQVVRELKIRKENLTLKFAEEIPRGMLDYVENILWRMLSGKPERYEVLLTLFLMTDFLKYSVHQDLYNYLYIIAKEQRLGRRVRMEEILTDLAIEDISRYLAREGTTFTFRLPHDSWADVLRGKSNGPMSPEIIKMNSYYTKDKRRTLITEAARRTWFEVIKDIDDEWRREAFKKNIELNFGSDVLKDIMENPPEEIIVPTVEEITYRDQTSLALKQAETLLKKSGVMDIMTLARRVRMPREDLEAYLSENYIISGNLIISPEYVKNALLEELEKTGRLDLEEFSMKKKIPLEVLETFKDKIERNTIQSPSGIYYSKSLVDRVHQVVLNEVKKGAPRSLKDIAELIGISLSDLENIISGSETEKNYIEHRLRTIIEGKQRDKTELESLAKKFEKHDLSKEDLNLLGTTYLILWELTHKKEYFQKAEKFLEKAGLPKSYENLAIAYYKCKKYRKAQKYAKKAGIKI